MTKLIALAFRDLRSNTLFNYLKNTSVLLCLLFLSGATLASGSAINISGDENGLRMQGKFTLWFDETAALTLEDARQALLNGEFKELQSSGSTGLKAGAVWSHFYLHNTSNDAVSLNLEYVDHQLIRLSAYSANTEASDSFSKIADLALDRPFDERPIPHHRFVFNTRLAAGQSKEYFVKFSSDDKGFVFPNLRIWTPKNMIKMETKEAATVTFLFGGLFLMSIIALVVGFATKEKFFYADSLYLVSKILAWGTILGFTHQFFITENFHWSYMSLTGAFSIFCGLLFSRIFLQTRKYTPKFDYLLLFMMANAGFLFICALLKLTALAVMSITIALLLYPVVSIVGIRRYLQGSKEAGVFALAWTFLVAGFVFQAMRDLGFVEHNFTNYYWPLIATYSEMVVIMVAMGIRLRRLRQQKIDAEHRYTLQLEDSKSELEMLVKQRTKELERQKLKAELEACTDALTGTHNRRSFFAQGTKLLEKAKLKQTTVSLLMFDIDNFKVINDNYGHLAGDEALRCFSDAIIKRIRDTDIFGRIGGEEFSLLLCGSKQHALQTAERLRNDICQLRIETPCGELQLTTSIGVAHLHDENMLEELLNQADKALYKAKQKGRNQVIEFAVA